MFTGDAASAFGFSDQGTGADVYAGQGASEFGFATSGAGAQTFTGAGASSFGWSVDAGGLVAGVIVGPADVHGDIGPAPRRQRRVYGRGASAFAWAVAARGDVDITRVNEELWLLGLDEEGLVGVRRRDTYRRT